MSSMICAISLHQGCNSLCPIQAEIIGGPLPLWSYSLPSPLKLTMKPIKSDPCTPYIVSSDYVPHHSSASTAKLIHFLGCHETSSSIRINTYTPVLGPKLGRVFQIGSAIPIWHNSRRTSQSTTFKHDLSPCIWGKYLLFSCKRVQVQLYFHSMIVR